MADSVIAQGTLPGGETFQILLDGIGTYKQNEKMLAKLDALVKRFKATEVDTSKLNEEKKEETKQTQTLNKNLEKSNDNFHDLQIASNVLRGNFKSLTENTDYSSKKLMLLGAASAGVYTAIGALTAYSGQLGVAIQRGIAGDIFDFAVSSKIAGLNLQQFNKALSETDGSFVALGGGASESSRRFAGLVSEVREATAATGNLGFNNEQLANFTAQQLKIAASQGFKGRQAQDAVIRSSENVGKSFMMLAESTGRSVEEIINAANKLSLDPVVSSFVRSAGSSGMAVSEEIKKLAGDFRGIFGEAGDKIAEELIKSTVGNLPFVMTQAGKNMILASGTVYEEMQRQAAMARDGIERTEEDQQRLRDLVMQEADVRGQELRMLAQLGGATGDAANQILAMARSAAQMNTEQGREAAKRNENARAFNHAVNELQASLQAAMIPFLEVLSTINFTALFETLSAFAQGLRIILTPLELLGRVIGSDTLVGTLVGSMIALTAVLVPLGMAYINLKRLYGSVSKELISFSMSLRKATAAAAITAEMRTGAVSKYDKLTPKQQSAIKAGGIGLGGAAIGLGLTSFDNFGSGAEISSAVGGTVGALAGTAAGSALAATALGRIAGGVLGTTLGPMGSVIGATLGGLAGQALGEYISGSGGILSSQSDAIDQANAANPSNQKVISLLEDIKAANEASIGVQSRSVAVADSSNRYLREQSMYLG